MLKRNYFPFKISKVEEFDVKHVSNDGTSSNKMFFSKFRIFEEIRKSNLEKLAKFEECIFWKKTLSSFQEAPLAKLEGGEQVTAVRPSCLHNNYEIILVRENLINCITKFKCHFWDCNITLCEQTGERADKFDEKASCETEPGDPAFSCSSKMIWFLKLPF